MIKNFDAREKTDEELTGLAKNEPDFYYFLMERYEDKIMRYVGRIANVTHETAEDLVQEIFLKAYENINDFDPSLKFSSWLYRIAHNHVISFWRKHKNEKVLSWDADENFKNMFEAELDLPGDLDKKITAEKLSEILGRIRPTYRDVLILRYMEDKDYNEISDILRRPVGTVGTLILRAKKELKKVIEKNRKVLEVPDSQVCAPDAPLGNLRIQKEFIHIEK